MRNVNIHGFNFRVLDEPSDYWGWIESGHYKNDFSTIKTFANPETTCIDLGAWVGADTLYASQLFKEVYAIEPDPVAFDMLVENISANRLKNVTLVPQAIMDVEGTTSMGGSLLGCSCTRQTCSDNQVTVPCTTLREFCKDIPGPLFLKIDVEGAEAQILRDWQWFAERKPDVMLSTHLCWWKEGGSDGTKEYELINKVAKLYKHVLHNDSKSKVNIASQYGDVLFTDKC